MQAPRRLQLRGRRGRQPPPPPPYSSPRSRHTRARPLSAPRLACLHARPCSAVRRAGRPLRRGHLQRYDTAAGPAYADCSQRQVNATLVRTSWGADMLPCAPPATAAGACAGPAASKGTACAHTHGCARRTNALAQLRAHTRYPPIRPRARPAFARTGALREFLFSSPG
jgi:hypothetical protein